MLIRRCCNAVLKFEGFTGLAEISVNLVDDEAIKELNAKFRNKDIETDVLSFPSGEQGKYEINPETGASMLGDIVISVERAAFQAEQYNHTLQREMGFLTVHSVFHLLGYDHEDGGVNARIMREKEEKVLEMLGLRRDISIIS